MVEDALPYYGSNGLKPLQTHLGLLFEAAESENERIWKLVPAELLLPKVGLDPTRKPARFCDISMLMTVTDGTDVAKSREKLRLVT